MNVIKTYIDKCREIADTIESQHDLLAELHAGLVKASLPAEWFMYSARDTAGLWWKRCGHVMDRFPGFNPIVELSLTYHNNVVGANGQRQAMYLENVPGLAERILRNFGLDNKDSALVVSSSGCNIVPIEIAEIFRLRKIKVVAIVTKQHLEMSQSKRTDGKKLSDFADLVLDTGAPVGDSMITIPGLETPVSPGSTAGGIMLINCIKAEVARLLTEAGHPPKVLTAPALVGAEKAKQLFESAYDEHAHRMAEIYRLAGN